MKQGDYKIIGLIVLIILGLSGFMPTILSRAIAAQNITLGLPGLGSVVTNLLQGGGLSVNTLLQVPPTQNITLAWNPSASSNIVGYDVYYGGLNGIYTNEIPVGNVTNVAVAGLLGGTTYYFVVTAVNNSGIQSSFSSQVPYTVPNAPVLGSPVYSGGSLSFSVTGISGNSCVIEVSTDLINWIPLETNIVPFQFTDSNANQFSSRFYRAVYP
jgi:Fibronectin type III domain